MPLTALILASMAAGALLIFFGLGVLLFKRAWKRWGSAAIVWGFLLQLWWIALYTLNFYKSVMLRQPT